MKIRRLSSRLSSIASSAAKADNSFEEKLLSESKIDDEQSIKVRDQSDESKSNADSQFDRDEERDV